MSPLVLVRELDALVDGRLELRDELLEPALLVVRDVAHGEHLLGAIRPELHLGREIGQVRHGRRDVGALVNFSLAGETAEARLGHPRGSVRHGERRRTRASLRLHNLGARVLDADGERLELFGGELGAGVGLGEEGEDGDARVAANDGNVDTVDVEALRLRDEGVGADHVEGGDAEDLLGVVDASLLVHLRCDGDGGVHGVGDDVEDGLGAVLSARLAQVLDDACVDGEEVVAGHAGLAGNARGDDDEVASLERVRELFLAGVALDGAGGVGVGQVRGDAGSVRNVVKRKIRDEGVHLEQKGEGLADATGGAEDCNLRM